MTTKLAKNGDAGKCIDIGSSDPLLQVLWRVDAVVTWIRKWIKVRMTNRPCPGGSSITPSLSRPSVARKFLIRNQWLKHSLQLAQALRNLCSIIDRELEPWRAGSKR